jgi:hypothetical protein
MAELSRSARFRPRDATRIIETPYLPGSARGLETRWRIGLPGRLRTLVTQMAPSGLTANEIAGVLISMMARGTKGSIKGRIH